MPEAAAAPRGLETLILRDNELRDRGAAMLGAAHQATPVASSRPVASLARRTKPAALHLPSSSLPPVAHLARPAAQRDRRGGALCARGGGEQGGGAANSNPYPDPDPDH
eukprot:scaffold111200_cov57-Phaeocystis_antarctica.AAC.1